MRDQCPPGEGNRRKIHGCRGTKWKILEVGGANKCNIGEHHNIRKQIFRFFFGTRLSLFGGGGGGGGAREQVPPPPSREGFTYIVNYWKNTNNLCIHGLLKFSRLGFEVADEFFISISFEF